MKKYIMSIIFCGLSIFSSSGQLVPQRIVVRLSSSVFSDTYMMVFKTSGKIELDDHDAQKIADGYVTVASYHKTGAKLAIEEQPFPQQDKEIPLYVKGYNSNIYQLQVVGADLSSVGMLVTLYDKFIQKKIKVTAARPINYSFFIDTAVAASHGEGRFSLLLTKINTKSKTEVQGNELLAFPNPWRYQLSLDVKNNSTPWAEIYIRDLMGRVIWRKEFKNVQPNEVFQLDVASIASGIYLLEWVDRHDAKRSKTLKIIKQ